MSQIETERTIQVGVLGEVWPTLECEHAHGDCDRTFAVMFAKIVAGGFERVVCNGRRPMTSEELDLISVMQVPTGSMVCDIVSQPTADKGKGENKL